METATTAGQPAQYLNRGIATLLILTNLFFLFLTYEIIRTGGGGMGWGLLLLPFLFLAHATLIPAALSFRKKGRTSKVLPGFNLLGLLWNTGLLLLLLPLPKPG